MNFIEEIMNKTPSKKSENWTCDLCGREAENLYFIDNGMEVCDSCRHERTKETTKGNVSQ
jgi:ribosome-binding protein aMBF1 (putative translation factor)